MNNFRIGTGEDSHAFSQNFLPQKPLTLGGIIFENEKKSFEANSDGDVFFHAICNSILSSVGEKTLDSFAKKMCDDGIINSQKYVEKSLEIVKNKFPNFCIQNIVISYEGKIPKIAPKHDLIQKNIAKILGLDLSQVGLTYTSGENLSAFGKGLGGRCLVNVLIKK